MTQKRVEIEDWESENNKKTPTVAKQILAENFR